MPRNWMPQFRKAFADVVGRHSAQLEPNAGEVKGLPLIEVRAKTDNSPVMAIIIPGDGGWAGIDRYLGEKLSTEGVAVVGFNSLQYFWKRRTPEIAAADLEMTLKHYLSAWNMRKAVIVEYSLGADVLPFMVSRLSGESLGHIQMVILLGPGQEADFEFHLSDWLGGFSSGT